MRKPRIVRKSLRVHNADEKTLGIWIEPLGERYELDSQQTIDIVFIGMQNGSPEVSTRTGEMIVYGWENSVAVALRNGNLAAKQPTVDEIIKQELEIGGDHVIRTEEPYPYENVAMVQRSLDAVPPLDDESLDDISKFSAHLVFDLAKTLQKSVAAADVLWRIASRIMATKGVIVMASNPAQNEALIWDTNPPPFVEMLSKYAIPVLTKRQRRDFKKQAKSETMPLRAEFESY